MKQLALFLVLTVFICGCQSATFKSKSVVVKIPESEVPESEFDEVNGVKKVRHEAQYRRSVLIVAIAEQNVGPQMFVTNGYSRNDDGVFFSTLGTTNKDLKLMDGSEVVFAKALKSVDQIHYIYPTGRILVIPKENVFQPILGRNYSDGGKSLSRVLREPGFQSH